MAPLETTPGAALGAAEKKSSAAAALSSQQLTKLRKIFRYFDTDGSGAIDREELAKAMNRMGMKVTEEALDSMLGTGENAKEEISFEEFAEMVSGAQSGEMVKLATQVYAYLTRTVKRAKALAKESGRASTLSLDQQLTELFHMQNHYRLITNSQASVDTWSEWIPHRELEPLGHMPSTSSTTMAQTCSGPFDYSTLLGSTAHGASTTEYGSWIRQAREVAKETSGTQDSLGRQINTFLHMRHHVNRIQNSHPNVDCWHERVIRPEQSGLRNTLGFAGAQQQQRTPRPPPGQRLLPVERMERVLNQGTEDGSKQKKGRKGGRPSRPVFAHTFLCSSVWDSRYANTRMPRRSPKEKLEQLQQWQDMDEADNSSGALGGGRSSTKTGSGFVKQTRMGSVVLGGPVVGTASEAANHVGAGAKEEKKQDFLRDMMEKVGIFDKEKEGEESRKRRGSRDAGAGAEGAAGWVRRGSRDAGAEGAGGRRRSGVADDLGISARRASAKEQPLSHHPPHMREPPTGHSPSGSGSSPFGP